METLGQTLHERRCELVRALDDARRALDAFDDAWGAQDWAWLRDAGYITPGQCAERMKWECRITAAAS